MKKPSPRRISAKKQTTASTKPHHTVFENHFKSQEANLRKLYDELYHNHTLAVPNWELLVGTIRQAFHNRPSGFKIKDQSKTGSTPWYLSNTLVGMSLYVDRFSDNLQKLGDKLDYLKNLGVNVLHLMPLFESPDGESDGGYAVSDFRMVNPRFGSLDDLKVLIARMQEKDMYLMLDMVLNHTSDQHTWAQSTRAGDPYFMDYYYMFEDRTLPDQFESAMPEIFPESAPGNFTYLPDCKRWVMTVFHSYQWDLNFSNPRVLVEMLDHIFFYANLGVDILRIDAPAFIWKQPGTNCQNLPEAHTLLRLIHLALRLATPGMAMLGEAIVSSAEIMKYFGTGDYRARECDFAYNATLMALQWDALATGKTKVLRSAQKELIKKPLGTTWITYTRCHDDIGLGFSDEHIIVGGFDPSAHRSFLKDYYSGEYTGSPARGALFSVNPKTLDGRISGTLASLCGLEAALEMQAPAAISQAIDKIILMQGHSIFIGGLPMLYYGDETGYLNDYAYLEDYSKNYDNRWMHRPIIDWNLNGRINIDGSPQQRIFTDTQRLLQIRRSMPVLTDFNNIEWLPDENIHVSGYVRHTENSKLFCLFNFGPYPVYLSWFVFKPMARERDILYDHWNHQQIVIGPDQQHIQIKGYGIVLAEWGADEGMKE